MTIRGVRVLRRIILFVFAVFCFLVTALTPYAIQAEAKQAKTVKVGYVLYQGYQEGREDEPKSGYGYEYLQQLAYYANWRYEYVYGGFSDLLEKLQKGEIDVMGNLS